MSNNSGRDLYKRLDSGDYVKFDPITNSYTIVRADQAPLLTPLSPGRARLSASEVRSDPLLRLRRVLLLAMLDVQEHATATGNPTGDLAALLFLARLATDPERLRSIPEVRWALPPLRAPTGSARSVVTASADAVRDVLQGTAVPSAADLVELVSVLPRMSPADLRRSRVLLDDAYGASLRRGGGVESLVKLARDTVESTPVRMSQASPVKRRPGEYLRL